jgi:S-formylglutathione hydrolase FrmB
MTSAVVVGRCAVSAGAVAACAAASRIVPCAVSATWAAAAIGEVASTVVELRVDVDSVEGGTASDVCAAAADITAGEATADVAAWAVITASTARRTDAKVLFTFSPLP